jgi:transcriptional regulator with XRE-family HTH domain
MKALYLPYRKKLVRDDSSWGLIGKDSHGADFGVGVGPAVEVAEQRLRQWVIDSLLAAAADGKDHLGDLVAIPPRGSHVTFMPVDLVPIRMRMIRAQKHLSQADVAKTLGLTQQAYAKLERPGANLQLRTIQQVEDALDAELLQLAPGRVLTAKLTAKPADNTGRRRTSVESRPAGSNVRGRRRTSTDTPPST